MTKILTVELDLTVFVVKKSVRRARFLGVIDPKAYSRVINPFLIWALYLIMR